MGFEVREQVKWPTSAMKEKQAKARGAAVLPRASPGKAAVLTDYVSQGCCTQSLRIRVPPKPQT